MAHPNETLPAISVCIPARNEEALIGACLDSIREAEKNLGAPVEIIVALNRCTDRTEQIALEHGGRVVREDAKNLSIIRNAAVREARAPYIVTIDADSRMSPTMLVEVKKRLDGGRKIGGGVSIIPERLSLGIIVSGLVIALCLLPLGISAGLFWCRKEDFDAIGGFNENLLTGEDVDFARRLRKHGARVGRKFNTILRAHIVSSCRKFDTFGDWYCANPILLWRFYKGIDRKIADEHWYDFKR